MFQLGGHEQAGGIGGDGEAAGFAMCFAHYWCGRRHGLLVSPTRSSRTAVATDVSPVVLLLNGRPVMFAGSPYDGSRVAGQAAYDLGGLSVGPA